jgi:tetratricopeptide (TPR) repeat protein/tRNA A-37 threonylcarbamoyl transferase component Bud32
MKIPQAASLAILAALAAGRVAADPAGQDAALEAKDLALLKSAQDSMAACADRTTDLAQKDMCLQHFQAQLKQMFPNPSPRLQDALNWAVEGAKYVAISNPENVAEPQKRIDDMFVKDADAASRASPPPAPNEAVDKAMDSVAKRDPSLFTAMSFGQYSLASGQGGRAEQFASQAIQSGPASADAYSLRAAARLQLGDAAGARADALEAGRREPDNRLSRTILSYAEAMENQPGARAPDPASLARLFGSRSAGSLAGGSAESPASLSGIQAAALGSERAGGASFATLSPSNKLAAEAASMAKIGDVKGAMKQAALAIQADPKNANAYAARAAAWNKDGSYLKAQYDSLTALRLDPNNRSALVQRGFSYAMTGHPAEAQADALKVLAADPRNAMAYVDLAMSQEGLGDLLKAKESYKRAAELDSSFKSYYDDFLSKHPELMDSAPQGSFSFIPSALRSQAALGALGAAALLAAAASLLLGPTRKRVSEGTVRADIPEPSPSPASAEAAQGLSTLPAGPDGSFRVEAAPTLASGGGSTRRTEAAGLSGPNGGRLIARTYEIRKELGRGGMGVVYEALDTALNRKVALKEMRSEIAQSTRDKERFLSEARTVAKFQHPNIVSIYNILEEGGRTFLVFEHVQGEGLDGLLDQRRKLAPDAALPLFMSIAAALDYSHSRKVIHRDLKPSNIMITEEGVVKVMDFGIAHEAKQTVSRLTSAEAYGTMAYMPPEQELGQTSKETDVFAFAVLAYETLLGTLPFPGPNFLDQKKEKFFQRPSQADPTLPAALDSVFEKALDPEPKNRHRSASEFAKAVASAVSAAKA